MKYLPGFEERIIKEGNGMYIKNAEDGYAYAEMILTNRNLIVFAETGSDNHGTLRVYPVQHITTQGGNARIITGSEDMRYIELYFADSSNLRIFFQKDLDVEEKGPL